ncbi:PREDICTED: toll-like receptor 5 [Nanorana parkeri]|uniref:toll-like receptor 5 n=1 Tax=Nanorana parkeri TaxID=125878 RepID=UPI00085427CB|nr:PREDICTED: toll-like receptor 5 [Nanorana parkeri]
MSDSSECNMFMAQSRAVYSCQAQGLLSVPAAPPDIQVLLLTFNHISSISNDSFPTLPKLQGLSLGGQNIKGPFHVGKGAFYNLPNLNTLDLGGNRNVSLHPEAFKGLYQLEVLLLDSNGLDESVLESSLFSELFSLRMLDLSYNNIHRLQPDPSFLRLKSFSTLILKFNKIHELCGNDLQNFKGRRLELLDLSYNPLQVSNTSLCANPFVNITLGTLDISLMSWSAEKFGQFFRTISGTPVKNVKMSHSAVLGSGFGFSNIKNPDNKTFEGLNSSNVYHLDLSHSFVSQLNPGVFSAFSELLSLDLSFSKISSISKGSFAGLTGLVSLNMSSNILGDITVNSFESLWASPLQTLDLSVNNIGAIQFRAMDGLASLSTLNLRDNALQNIPQGKLPALTLVLFKQNRISDIYGLTAFCPNCTFLDLSSNRLTDLKSLWHILELESLKTLLLSSNKLSCCSAASKSISKSKLHYLDLSDNDLGQIWNSGQCSDIFTNLELLEILSLSKNQITSIPEELFSGLKGLSFLDLSRNNLRLIQGELFTGLKELKTLNLGSNNLVTLSSSSFQSLTSLQTLDLSQVTPVCTCGLSDFWNWMRTTNVTVNVRPSGELTCLRLSSPIQEMSLSDYFNEC